jgi:hypothetical protein
MIYVMFIFVWTGAVRVISLLPQRHWKRLKKKCWNCIARDQTWKMVIQFLMSDAVGGHWLYTLPRITVVPGLQESAIPRLKKLLLRRNAGIFLDIV